MGLIDSKKANVITRLRADEIQISGENWRTLLMERLQDHAFSTSMIDTQGQAEGWTRIDDAAATDFSDTGAWLYEPWILFGYRIDSKRIPGKTFRLEVDRRCKEWMAEREVERCPGAVRAEIRDEVREEMLKRAVPTVKTIEVAFNLDSRYVYVTTGSEADTDRIRKRFFRTFGIKLFMGSPLDLLLPDIDTVDELLASNPIDFRGLTGNQGGEA